MNTYNNNYRSGNSKLTAMNGMLGAALFMLCFSCFVSCSDDLTNADAEAMSYDLTRGYTDEQVKVQRLGFSYDAAGNVMDDSSFSAKPIINMDRLQAAEKDLGPIISSERRHYTSMDIFSGNTLQELGHAETKYTIDDSEVIGSGKYYRNNTTLSHTTWHNSYKAHMFIKHIMATRTIDVGTLHCLKLDDLNDDGSVLEADFRNAVAELVKKGDKGVTEADATKFSEKFGTHLVVSSNLGGMIELQMEIERDSCVDKEYTAQEAIQNLFGESVSKTTNSKVIKEISKRTVHYKGNINVKGGKSADRTKLHRTFDEEKAADVKISDGDYYGWANNISIAPDTSYNASFVSGRFLPFYQLFEDSTSRKVMRQVYQLYLKKEAPTQEVYEPDYGIMPVKGNYGPDVRVAASGSNKACIICQEYVPSIRSDKPCIVAYPLIRGNDGKSRPFFYSGLFVGDESHRPGRIIWEGSASVYTPSDSIFFESDSIEIRNLFDPATHALKNVYFYWNAVHPLPCATKQETPKAYTTTVFSAQPKSLAKPTTFAKVASTFWSVNPVVLKNDSSYGILSYWKDDERFTQFAAERNKTNSGTLLVDTIYNKYYFSLVDGGNNYKRAKDETNDKTGDKRWINAISQSVNALDLKDWLPNVEESQSITKMLGNRMSIFYSHDFYDGRNMLGLDWPTGYWVISHPEKKTIATTPQQNDGQGMPVITWDAGQARIMRLSGSGTDLLLEYPEYVRAFNYSDEMFFKFFPIYITVRDF